MEQCIQEHHGYFSMDMNHVRGKRFDNRECKDNRFCMIFLERGTMEIRWDERKKLLESGPLLFCINEKEHISIQASEPVEVVVFHPHVLNSAFDFGNIRENKNKFSVSEQQDCYFLTPFLERTKRTGGAYCMDGFSAKRVAVLIQQFEREITLQDTDYWPCRSRSCLMEILSLVLNSKEEQEGDSGEKLISEVRSYLISHMEEKIKISDLTKEFHKNRTDLSRLFLDETGQTIMEYLKEQRMEFAAVLVRGTGLPFTVIMERVGFFQYAYFSRSFKEYKGMSPRAYRRSYGEEEKERQEA